MILISSCEDVIEVDLPTSEPQLVIEALVGYNENDGDPITIGQVKLTITAPFFEEEVIAAENATVEIIDETTEEVFVLLESEPGLFTNGFPDFQFDREYRLEVTYNNQLFTATEQLIPTGTINNIEQGDGFIFDEEEETEVVIDFSDIPNQRDYYLFSFGFQNFLVTDDEFYQNSNLTFSYFYDDVSPGDLLTITLFGIDKDFANYVDLILVQSGENSGGPFSTPPATVRGNIVNTTNPSNFAFGYFSISEFDIQLLTVQ